MYSPTPLEAATSAVKKTHASVHAKIAKLEADSAQIAAAAVLAAVLPLVLEAIEEAESDAALSIEPIWDMKQAILTNVKKRFGI